MSFRGLAEQDKRDIGSLHGVRRKPPPQIPSKTQFTGQPWGKNWLVDYMRGKPEARLSAASLASNNLHAQPTSLPAKRSVEQLFESIPGAFDPTRSTFATRPTANKKAKLDAQMDPNHHLSWADDTSSPKSAIELGVDGRGMEKSGTAGSPIDVDDDDLRQSLALHSSRDGSSRPSKAAHTIASRSGFGSPTLGAVQVSSTSADELDIIDRPQSQAAESATRQPVFVKTSNHDSMVQDQNFDGQPEPNRWTHDSMSALPRQTSASASYGAMAKGPTPSGGRLVNQIRPNSPSYDPPDLPVTETDDPIQDWSDPEVQVVPLAGSSKLGARVPVEASPSFKSIANGNTKAKAEQYSSTSGRWRKNAAMNAFQSSAQGQQSHAERSQQPQTGRSLLKVKSLMRGKPDVQRNGPDSTLTAISGAPRRQEKDSYGKPPASNGRAERGIPTHLRYPSDQPTIQEVVDMTVQSDDEVSQEQTPRTGPSMPTSRQVMATESDNYPIALKAPREATQAVQFAGVAPNLSSKSPIQDEMFAQPVSSMTQRERPSKPISMDPRFAAMPDDPAMGKTITRSKGKGKHASNYSVPIEFLFFGGLQINPVSPDKRYELRWTQHLFTLTDPVGRAVTGGVFGSFDSVQLNDKASYPVVILLHGGDAEFVNRLIQHFQSASLPLDTEQSDLLLKLATDDRDCSGEWRELWNNLTAKPLDPRFEKQKVEAINAPIATGMMKQFASMSKSVIHDPTAIKRAAPPSHLDMNTQGQSKLPSRLPPNPIPSRAPGNLVLMPSNRPPSSRSSIPDGRLAPMSSTARSNRQQQARAIPSRETRSTTRSKQADVETYHVFQAARSRPASPDASELMLVWPLDSKTGAVNITYGDYKRLEPQEFLNDTLIEFGLKLWYKQLSEKNPELARDVHMFNTFFYKKISNKDFDAGYESVRKWTNKIDIFDKKYIIVPINEHLHWYLAIICNPKGILRPPPLPPPTAPRKSLRLSSTRIDLASGGPSTAVSGPSNVVADEVQAEILAPDDQDVDMVDAGTGIAGTDSAEIVIPPDIASSPDVDAMDLDPPDPDQLPSPELGDHLHLPYVTAMDSLVLGEGTAQPEQASISVGGDGDEQTLIFTFDSLGGGHKPAVNILKKYLQAEAKEKKGISETTVSIGRTASVITQQNFCDCGLFVLQFVTKFMEDPARFKQECLDKSKKPRGYWDNLWDRPAVDEMRGILKAKIQSLSAEWKEKRQAQTREVVRMGKEKEVSITPSGDEGGVTSKTEDSDDEVLWVGEKTKTPSPKVSRKGKGKERGKDKERAMDEDSQEVRPVVEAAARRRDSRLTRTKSTDSAHAESSQEVTIIAETRANQANRRRSTRESIGRNRFIRD